LPARSDGSQMHMPFQVHSGGRAATLSAALAIGVLAAWASWDLILAPPPAAAQSQVGEEHLGKGEYRKAVAAFDQALAIDPDHRGALMGKARALLQLGELEAAGQALDRVIRVLKAGPRPEDAQVRGQLAAAYSRRGQLNDRLARYDQALTDYVRSLTLDAEIAQASAFRGLRAGREALDTSIRDRAEYLYKQLQLPEDQRVMIRPVIEQAEMPTRP